jgi:hypothetical protein
MSCEKSTRYVPPGGIMAHVTMIPSATMPRGMPTHTGVPKQSPGAGRCRSAVANSENRAATHRFLLLVVIIAFFVEKMAGMGFVIDTNVLASVSFWWACQCGLRSKVVQ